MTVDYCGFGCIVSGAMAKAAKVSKRLTFDDVKEMGLALPGVETSTAYGATCLKVGGQLMVCPALNKSAEPNSIGFRVPFDQRDGLLAEAPETYYITDHYVNYPCVLV